VKKRGADDASWYVGWIDPEGKRRCKSCGAGARGKRAADKLRQKREAELIEGTYQNSSKKTWEEFRQEYEEKVVPGLAIRSRDEVKYALDNFERVVKPGKVATIKTRTIDDFVAKRRREPGKKKGDLVSPATVNKDLRHVRAALKKAKRWGYIGEVPYFDMEKVPKELPNYVTPEHFAAIYKACEQARMPADIPNILPVDWWRGLIVFAYMTGWRIGALLALHREDVDLNAGTAISWHDDNKGKRDVRVPRHPAVIPHLRKLTSFDPAMFPWNHDRTTLMNEFARIQDAAGIKLACHGKHEHTLACHVYGFHDLRRAFATMNANRMSGEALQQLMQHQSYSTTQGYINSNYLARNPAGRRRRPC